MKKYVLLSYNITGMGGGQMYQYNKLRFMKNNGYDTYIISSVKGEVIISDFYNVSQIMFLSELNIDPNIMSRKSKNFILEKVFNFVNGMDDQCIIECDNKTTSIWGELLASKYHCISHVLIIDERIGTVDEGTLDFFKHKRNKKELRGLKNETYEMIFHEVPSSSNYNYILDIATNNVVQNIEYVYSNLEKKDFDYKICCLGRLDKEYVPTLIGEIKKFCLKNKKLKILFGMIGDAPSSKIKSFVYNELNSIDNLDILLYGAMYPISISLINYYDVFVSSAGSARVSGNLAVPTITIDARDYNGIGIFQVTTMNTVFRDYEKKIAISDLLQYVYEHHLMIKEKLKIIPTPDFNDIYRKHLDYYDTLTTGDYYNFNNYKLSKIKSIEKFIYKLFGINIYLYLKKIVFSRRK